MILDKLIDRIADRVIERQRAEQAAQAAKFQQRQAEELRRIRQEVGKLSEVSVSLGKSEGCSLFPGTSHRPRAHVRRDPEA